MAVDAAAVEAVVADVVAVVPVAVDAVAVPRPLVRAPSRTLLARSKRLTIQIEKKTKETRILHLAKFFLQLRDFEWFRKGSKFFTENAPKLFFAGQSVPYSIFCPHSKVLLIFMIFFPASHKLYIR